MEIHQVKLFHHRDHFYVVKMSGDRDGSVRCTTFTKNAEETVTCAWPDCVASVARSHCEFWSKPWADCPLTQRDENHTDAIKAAALMDAQGVE